MTNSEWNAIVVKATYRLMVKGDIEVRNGKLYSKSYGGPDLSTYLLPGNCAFRIIARYWIWGKHE
jgi:hypothetical protein